MYDAGTVFRLKGGIIRLSFVDLNCTLIPPVAEPWKDASHTDDATASKDKTSCNSMLSLLFDFYQPTNQTLVS